MQAGDVKRLTYYATPDGPVYVTAIEQSLRVLSIGRWALDEGAWKWLGDLVAWTDDRLDWTETARPLDACPADPDAPRVPRLVWRTVGRTKALHRVDVPEPGDEPFVFGWGT